MRIKTVLLSSAVVAAGCGFATNAMAQSADAIETVVVSGIRESMESAIALKKNATGIVDSIVAEDIGKFPDQNVADSLQHITGIQITRDLGEGATIAIRGLSQVESMIDGQEVLTSGGTRSLNMEDIPAELVSGVDVYKTSSANLLEGGLGGVVNIRTHRPFDFDGLQASVNIRANYGSLRQKLAPQGSVLISDRWNTSIGEIGALLDVSFQRRNIKQYYENVGSPATNTYAETGTTLIQPNVIDKMVDNAQRDRFGINSAVQWRPVSNLEIYALGRFTRLATYENRFGTTAYTSAATSIPGTFTTFSGTNDVATGSYANASLITYGVSRDVRDSNQNYTLGATWTGSKLVVSGNVNYLKSNYYLDYRELDLNATAPTTKVDFTTTVPSVTYLGLDMTSLNTFKVGNMTWSENKYVNEGLASRLDAQWMAKLGPISEIDAGFRYSTASNVFSPIRYYVPTGLAPATNYSHLFKLMDTDIFSNNADGVPMTRTFYVAESSYLRRDFQGLRDTFGIGATPIAPTPLSIYSLNERTTSGYVMAKLDTEVLVPIDGDFGLRFVNTNSSMIGNQTDLVNGGYKSISKHSEYFDILPSVNLRLHLSDDFIMRVAASKTVTRPDFYNLTPGLTLVPANATGTSGNPNLKPLYATQVDTAFEYYFTRSDSVYVSLFYKDVKNFISNKGVSTNIDGINYTISMPVNGDSGTVKGYEIGYTQFYDFLPAPFNGLGLQANYTYVDSSAPTSVSGYTASLPQLSRHSYNLIGMYENGPVSVRVAYNWRSKYYSSIYFGAGAVGLNPIFMKPFGWLNASINYNVTDNLVLSLEGNNLLDTMQSTYYSVESRTGQYTVNDREFMVGLRYKL